MRISDLPPASQSVGSDELCFSWNDSWTFADLASQQRGWRQRWKRFLKNRYVANLLAIAVVTIWNFWVNLKLSWRVTQVK